MTIGSRRQQLADATRWWALLQTLSVYWGSIWPVARAEIERWRRRSTRIPDPELRSNAIATIAEEHLNAESAAVFAVLARTGRARRTAVRLLVSYQLMYDYLDTLTEQPVDDPLANSRQLHRALTAALGRPRPAAGYYVHYPRRADGGYLDALVAACRRRFERLPAARAVAPSVVRAAQRSAEGQSQNHAALRASRVRLARWSRAETPAGSGLRWWETAAAAGSSLAIHALLASAADPAVTRSAAERIERAYWPWINALNTLLESLVDRDDDAATGNHSYVSHYPDGDAMASRLGTIADQAARSASTLPRAGQHAAILAGMTAFYLAAADDEADTVATVARVRAALGRDVAPLLVVLRLRRVLASAAGGGTGDRR